MAITFKLKLEKPCVEWKGCTTRSGHGIRYYAPTDKSEMVHRVAYAEANCLTMDDIKGVIIRHKCDNPGCIEPTHLLAGTQADNMRDMMERHRNHNINGEANPYAKLTADHVREIKRRLAEGHSQVEIAAHFNIKKAAVNHIKSGRNWSWLSAD